MDLYSEIILDHFKNPRNKEKLKDKSLVSTECNPLCGDKVQIFLKLNKQKKIEKATFTGSGCAISQASASMLTEKLIGKPLSYIKNLKNEDIIKMLGIEISAGRLKCATLSLQAAKSAIK